MRSHAWNSWNRQLGVAGRPCLHVPLPTNAFHMYKSLGCLPKKTLTLQPLRGSRSSWCSSLSVHGAFWVALVLHTDWQWTQPRLVLHMRSCYFEGYWLPCPDTIGIREYVSNDLTNSINSINSIKHNCPILPKSAAGSQPSKPQQEFQSLNWPTVAVSKLSELYGDSQRFPRVCGGKPILYQSMTFVLLLCIFVD